MADLTSLDDLSQELLDAAATKGSGRSSTTVTGGRDHIMRQTVIALLAGEELAEHDSPGEATLQVLRGRVDLQAGSDSWEAKAGDLVGIPPHRHSLHALEDSVVLLTAVPRQHLESTA